METYDKYLRDNKAPTQRFIIEVQICRTAIEACADDENGGNISNSFCGRTAGPEETESSGLFSFMFHNPVSMSRKLMLALRPSGLRHTVE